MWEWKYHKIQLSNCIGLILSIDISKKKHRNYPYTDKQIQYYELHESYIVTKSVTDVSVDASCLGSSFQLVSRFDLLYSSFTNSRRGSEIHVDIIKAYGIQCGEVSDKEKKSNLNYQSICRYFELDLQA